MDPAIVAAKASSIFSLPDVVFHVNELIESGNASNAELEKVISNDTALTAKLLKFANSSYFGFSGKIETVFKAITVIGHKELRNLILATSVTSTFKGIPANLVDMNSFWNHSIACGVTARLLTNNVSSRERFFIIGLLHGVGRLVMFSQFPKESMEMLMYADQDDNTVIQAERKIFGFTYAQLSAELLKQWKLPPNIWMVIENQLDPKGNKEYLYDASTLSAAISIANFIQPCIARRGEVHEISESAINTWSFLGLTAEVVESVITVAKLQIIEVYNSIR
mgnify:CR=1 FL=1